VFCLKEALFCLFIFGGFTSVKGGF
jgi:hypothetical protein